HEVAFSRSELALLLNIDGRHSTAEIIRGRELAGTLYTLTRLSEVGVINLDPPDEPVDSHPVPPSAIRSNGPSGPGTVAPGVLNGQLLLINRAAYFHVEGTALAGRLPDAAQGTTRFMFGGPKRGDVVVFQTSSPPDTELVKRIIGLPGESVRIEAGKVLVDNRL